MPEVNRVGLLDALDRAFSAEDAQDLAFELGVEWDNLAGEGKRSKLRELIEECLRADRMDELLAAASRHRPLAIIPGTKYAESPAVPPPSAKTAQPSSKLRPHVLVGGAVFVFLVVLLMSQLSRLSRSSSSPQTPTVNSASGAATLSDSAGMCHRCPVMFPQHSCLNY